MKAVLDANVIVSAFRFGGKPRQIVAACIGKKFTGYASQQAIKETTNVFTEKLGYSTEELDTTLKIIGKALIYVATAKRSNYPKLSRQERLAYSFGRRKGFGRLYSLW